MKKMDPALKLAALLILLGLTNVASYSYEFGYCQRVVKSWALSVQNQVTEDSHRLRDLLFFLHVPRTGGRTYFHCFLKKLYPSTLECPRSYDKLRFDPSKQKCRLLVTHDDYSMMSKLPKERTSVVTILRDPIDRVFSTYEFSIEVAARFLVHPNLTSATRTAARLRSKSNAVSTLDIWPWKYLVPWMREDLFARRDARRRKGSGHYDGNDPYNMEDIAIPLHKYINDPIAQDIVHNGATFQVAGITNNSYYPESHEVRHCVMQYPVFGEHVLQVAKRRLDEMLYVGLTEDHKESATMFANVVGAQVISQLRASGSSMENTTANNPEQETPSNSEPDDKRKQNISPDQKENKTATMETPETNQQNMSVENLMNAYASCITTLRSTQSRRRIASLKKIAPANFTKEARSHVSDAVLEQIKSLNNLDIELYGYAQKIFAKKHRETTQKSLVTEKLESVITGSFGSSFGNLIFLSIPIVVLALFIFLFVNARRRTSKVKV